MHESIISLKSLTKFDLKSQKADGTKAPAYLPKALHTKLTQDANLNSFQCITENNSWDCILNPDDCTQSYNEAQQLVYYSFLLYSMV